MAPLAPDPPNEHDEPTPVPLGTTFPDCCAKCGIAVGAVPRKLHFGYVHGITFLTVIIPPLFLLAAAISVLVTRGTVVFSIPICRRCFERWQSGRREVLGALVLGTIAVLVGIAMNIGVLAVPAVAAMLIIPVVLGISRQERAIRLVRFEGRVASLAGLHPDVATAIATSRAT